MFKNNIKEPILKLSKKIHLEKLKKINKKKKKNKENI